MKIILDPNCLINYASYYIEGVKKVYPQAEICWSSKAFPYRFADYNQFRQGIGMIIRKKGEADKKVYISFHDDPQIFQDAYDWCDVYASVNVLPADINEEKLFPIGPSFGVVFQTKFQALLLAAGNYLKLGARGFKPSPQEYLRGYLYPFVRRKRFDEIARRGGVREGYCFHLSTLWYDKLTDATTNIWRGEFFRSCKEMFHTEGGMLYLGSESVEREFPKYREYRQQFEGLLTSQRISYDQYLDKTRKSEVVFNTPSVKGCLGWKLPEYLAMGKAIISTPLDRVMPGRFEKDEHYIEVKDKGELRDSLRMLKSNPERRVQLEDSAKAYFEEYLRPEKVISRIFEKAGL